MIHQLRPIGIALLALLAGLVPALRFAPPAAPLVLVALTASAALLASSARSAGPLVALAFAAVGGALGTLEAHAVRADCRATLREGAPVTGVGALGAAAISSSRGRDPPPLLPLESAELRAVGGASCASPVRVRLPRGFAAEAGAELRVTGRWARMTGPPLPSGWPREPAFAGYVSIDTVLSVAPPDLLRHPLLTLRGRTAASLHRLFPAQGPLASALLLGRREEVDPEVRDVFARSGLVHLLAISGSHVAILAAMLLIAGSAARLPRRLLSLGCIAVVALYLAMIGAPASAVRAGVMLALGLSGTLLQRPAAHLATVSAAALVILALHPMAALDAGFQLSFAGVMGIVLARRLAELHLGAAHRRHPLYRFFGEPLVVSAAAFAATAPITAHHFGQVAPISIVASVPAIPVTALALVGVVAATTVEPLLAPLAALLADGASLALAALAWLAGAAAAVPFGHVAVLRPPWGAWVAAGLAAAMVHRQARALRPPVRTLAAAGVAISIALAAPVRPVVGDGGVEVHFIDVGQGDATAIRTPAGRWVLVDAGGRANGFDAGERRILPFLRAKGVRRLEALLLTHPDLDHIGGAPAVVRGVEVGRVIEPGLPVGKEIYRELLDSIEQRGVPWMAARSGRTIDVDAVRFRLLWPDSASLDAAPEANQISAVLALEYGGFRMLLTGDAPAEVERELVARHPELLRADVLKAGHHGSATSTSAELLHAVRPRLVVISCGRRNRYGHPAPSVMNRLSALGIEIARTDREGTVTLRASGGPDGAWMRVPN